jgi:FkbM family methyltransferase
MLMCLGRVTRFAPPMRGVGKIVLVFQAFYRRLGFLEECRLCRISNFDSDLLLDVNPADTIGARLWHLPQLWERSERRLFCSAVTPGSTVLDIGANIGVYTLLAAKRGARVFSIEADPANAAMLRHHVELNGFSERVTIFQMAASQVSGMVGLRRNPANCGGTCVVPGTAIEARTIDSLNLPPIDVCKMDIEGHEEAALRGMAETLARSPNLRLLIECNEMADRTAMRSALQRRFANIQIAGRRDNNLWCCP